MFCRYEMRHQEIGYISPPVRRLAFESASYLHSICAARNVWQIKYVGRDNLKKKHTHTLLHKNALTKVDWNFAQLLRHLTGCKFANRTSVSMRNQTIMPVHTTDYHPCTHCTDYCTVYLAGLIYMPPSAVCGIARNGRSHSSYRAKKKTFW